MPIDPDQRPIKRSGVSRAAFIIAGLLLGLLIGGLLGAAIGTPDNSLRRNKDPQAQVFADIFEPARMCIGFVAALVGAAVGGTMGAVAGIFLGRRALAADAPPGAAAILDAPETSEDEARRLKAKIAFIQDRLDDIERGERP
jgi:hypothetical protein